MPITARVGHKRWIEIEFTDPYTREESERVMQGIFSRLGLPRPLRFLVDVRRSSPPDAEFVIGAITFWQLHISDMWGARIAIITSTDSDSGVRMCCNRSSSFCTVRMTSKPWRAQLGQETMGTARGGMPSAFWIS